VEGKCPVFGRLWKGGAAGEGAWRRRDQLACKKMKGLVLTPVDTGKPATNGHQHRLNGETAKGEKKVPGRSVGGMPERGRVRWIAPVRGARKNGRFAMFIGSFS
jgi:hypothetical protein